MTFTGLVGTVCMFPLRAIVAASVALGIHPNTFTLIGVLINVAAACALGLDRFALAGVNGQYCMPNAARCPPQFLIGNSGGAFGEEYGLVDGSRTRCHDAAG